MCSKWPKHLEAHCTCLESTVFYFHLSVPPPHFLSMEEDNREVQTKTTESKTRQWHHSGSDRTLYREPREVLCWYEIEEQRFLSWGIVFMLRVFGWGGTLSGLPFHLRFFLFQMLLQCGHGIFHRVVKDVLHLNNKDGQEDEESDFTSSPLKSMGVL